MHFFLAFGMKSTFWWLRGTQDCHTASAKHTLWRYNVSGAQGKRGVLGFSWRWHPNTVQLRPAENWWNENIIIPTNATNLAGFSSYSTKCRPIYHEYFRILESQCSCSGNLSSKGWEYHFDRSWQWMDDTHTALRYLWNPTERICC